MRERERSVRSFVRWVRFREGESDGSLVEESADVHRLVTLSPSSLGECPTTLLSWKYALDELPNRFLLHTSFHTSLLRLFHFTSTEERKQKTYTPAFISTMDNLSSTEFAVEQKTGTKHDRSSEGGGGEFESPLKFIKLSSVLQKLHSGHPELLVLVMEFLSLKEKLNLGLKLCKAMDFKHVHVLQNYVHELFCRLLETFFLPFLSSGGLPVLPLPPLRYGRQKACCEPFICSELLLRTRTGPSTAGPGGFTN